VEVVTLRVRAAGSHAELPLPEAATIPKEPPRAVAEEKRKVLFGGRRRMTRSYDRGRLQPGTRLKAPAVISEYSATTLIPPGFKGRVDRWRNLILEPG
jgi:N-methylhydantoinase A